MSDATIGGVSRSHDWGSEQAQKRVKKRYRRDRILQAIGLLAITIAIVMLGILIGSLFLNGYTAFTQSKVTIPVTLDAENFDKNDPIRGNYRKAARDGFASYFPDVEGRAQQRQLFRIMSSQAGTVLRDQVVANPALIGTSFKAQIPLSDPFDQLNKGVIPRQISSMNSSQIEALEYLEGQGSVRTVDGQSVAELNVPVLDQYVDPEDPSGGRYDRIVNSALRDAFAGQSVLDYRGMLGRDAVATLREYVVANPEVIGTTINMTLPLAHEFDQYHRQREALVRNPVFGSEQQLAWYDSLVERGLISQPINWGLLTHADSRFPELAGLAGAIAGSFFALLVCFLISFPVGIAAAVYLEEFAPKNRWTDLIEVNINNLAAVPSVVFGLLGLAVFISFFGLPRSTPLVGGMVLSLMTLPTIIIATRAALKAVPPSIREAALGVGASKHQVVMHHVLPLAMPGILTGTIIGLAQALGETAPLLLIGMNAFIPAVDQVGVLQPATALPTQIYSWADSPERGFVARTSAAILVLLGFLVIMNGLAIYLRQRFQKKWS
jgi:phosphate transport system permease protein